MHHARRAGTPVVVCTLEAGGEEITIHVPACKAMLRVARADVKTNVTAICKYAQRRVEGLGAFFRRHHMAYDGTVH